MTNDTTSEPDVTRNPRYIFVLAVAAGLILVLGWLLRPGDSGISEAVASAPSQVELSRLPAMTVRRSLEDMSDFFGEVGDDLAPGLVRLESVRRSGVVWSVDRVVTARAEWRFPAAVTVGAGDGDVGAYTAIAGPHLPLAALRTPALMAKAPPRRRAADSLRSGEWVIAAWQGDAAFAFAPGTYLGTASRDCGGHRVDELVTTLPIRETMLGGGVFELDGGLVAVVLRCDGEDLAVTARSVEELLEVGATHDSQVRASWGLQVEPLGAAEAFHFGLGNGLVVRQLWERYPGEATGLRPGDVLVALDGVALTSVEGLRILDGDAAPNQEWFVLEVRRSLELLTVTLPARGRDTGLDVSTTDAAGLVWEETAPGFHIASVLPGTRADAVGIRPGDRLVRVDHQTPEDLDGVRELLADEGPTAFLELAREGRSWGVLLP